MHFFLGFFSGGDWLIFFAQTIRELSWFPQVWSATNGNGYGQNVAFVLGYKTFFAILVKFCTEILNLPWAVTEKIIFFIPFWTLTLLSSYFLSRYFFKNKPFNVLSSIIFATNTYSLMLVGGGQMGVSLAYAFSPFVLLFFLKLFDKQKVSQIVTTSLLLGLLLCIDPRVALIIVFIAFIFLLFKFSGKGILLFLSVGVVSILLNMFWILPFLFSGTSGLSDAYTNTDILYFLSFAKFENTISLFHPNWPENIFGKVGFMRPEFVLLPIIAFSAFLFKTDKKIKVLGMIALLGVFLAKGVNLPFGQVYYFVSDHIPLFTMFRDSTKWYLMVAMSYSVLIPFALLKASSIKYQVLDLKPKLHTTSYILLATFLFFWAFTVRQLFLGQLTGTFQAKTIPDEYVRLEKLLSSKKDFSRVLWVPQQSRFGYFSNTHPAVAAYDLVTSHEILPIFKLLEKKDTQALIKNSAIAYVVVPSDPIGEIYLTDRKYDYKVYEQFYARMKKISWLIQDKSFKDIGVFLVKNPKTLAFEANTGKKINLIQLTFTKYTGTIQKLNNPTEIIFSQQYDPHWVLKANNSSITSKQYKKKFNSFTIPSGSSLFTLEYATQKWVNLGVGISAVSLAVLIGIYLKNR